MKLNYDKWIDGKKQCLKHCKVQGMHIKVPYCLYCGKKLEDAFEQHDLSVANENS